MFKKLLKKSIQTNLIFKKDLLWIKKFLLTLLKQNKQGLQSQQTVMLMVMSLKTSTKNS